MWSFEKEKLEREEQDDRELKRVMIKMANSQIQLNELQYANSKTNGKFRAFRIVLNIFHHNLME